MPALSWLLTGAREFPTLSIVSILLAPAFLPSACPPPHLFFPPQRPPAQIPTSTRSHPSISREVRVPLAHQSLLPAACWEAVPWGWGLAGGGQEIACHGSTCALCSVCTLLLPAGPHRCEEGGVRVAKLASGRAHLADPGLCLQSPWEAALRPSTSSRISSSSHPSSLQPSPRTPTSQPKSKLTTGRARRLWLSWVGEMGRGEWEVWDSLPLAPAEPTPTPALWCPCGFLPTFMSPQARRSPTLVFP